MDSCDACKTPTTCSLVGCEKGAEYQKAHPASERTADNAPDTHTDAPRSSPEELGSGARTQALTDPPSRPESQPQPTSQSVSTDSSPSSPPSPEGPGGDTHGAAPRRHKTEEVPADLRRRLDTVVALAEAEFPDARVVRPGLHGSEVYVEVWGEHAARVYGLRGEEI